MGELFEGELYQILHRATKKRDFAMWNYVQTREPRKIPTIEIPKKVRQKEEKNWIALL